MALLYLLPALVLVVLMVLRRYPGERRLVALSYGRRRPSKAEPCQGPSGPRPRVWVPRGGLLIAFSLAVRPPPVPTAAIS